MSITTDFNETITSKQIETLDNLFDEWERVSIRTDEDYKRLVKNFWRMNNLRRAWKLYKDRQ